MHHGYEAVAEYTELLLSSAIRLCDNAADAEDLVSETQLAALSYLSRGGEIDDLHAWLFSVLHRRHNDMLRRKYRAVTVTIGEDFDIPDDGEIDEDLLRSEEAVQVRRAVAYLAKQYREIVVRHYFHGERVVDIADALGIPVGTVKSRLDFGRKQMKKGMETMKTYSEQSYQPKFLKICNSGVFGANMEPMSIVDDDVLGQNLLIAAYEAPISVSDLARSVGVAAAYIEPVVEKLVNEELMMRMGDGRVYTDFIIYTMRDHYISNPDKERFCDENLEYYLPLIGEAIEQLKQTDYYSEWLERFMLIDITASAIWNAGEPHRKPQIMPERPHGGRWIAFGTVYENGERRKGIPLSMRTREEYGMGGRRTTVVDEYAGGKSLVLHTYDTALNPMGYCKLESLACHNIIDSEEAFLQLAYLIEKGIDPAAVGYPPKLLAGIDGLCEEGFLAKSDDGLHLSVPHLTHAQWEDFMSRICRPTMKKIADALTEPMGEYLRTHKVRIPAHLDSVPDQKRTMPHEPPAMAFVFGAIRAGLHKRDLGPCPETVLIFD
ncbi:MAG: sigma-70 family RNA polymerase sigma factor [Clostridia bacterium]|nr:sigma-70 family RNA polymerase sigma factor [Clostridia bacterium]